MSSFEMLKSGLVQELLAFATDEKWYSEHGCWVLMRYIFFCSSPESKAMPHLRGIDVLVVVWKHATTI
jgi:hypothetical protein